MHASSLENMQRCYERYVLPSALGTRDAVTVIDVGGADVNGGYHEIFADGRFRYVTVDLEPGAGVDVVLDDPYRLPFESGSIDIVLSGQMLEHCEMFWLTFAEMVRVLRPGGFVFLIAPSAGPIHRYPVDCYRFYPDAYRALAKQANCVLVDVWLDERGPWRDLVGVFAKHQPAPVERQAAPSKPAPSTDPATIPPGTASEELIRGRANYRDVLAAIHKELSPSLYLEIGVRHGRSLTLADCRAVGVDPVPDIEVPLGRSVEMHALRSDDYFATMGEHPLPKPPDLAFIDGMHLFEFALRDFMNVERLAGPATLVVVDDIFPNHPAQAERNRRTRVWTGDIWKLHRCLTEQRPDLALLALDTEPTGLLLAAGLDPSNRVLWDNYNPVVRQYKEMTGPPRDVLKRDGAVDPGHRGVRQLLAALRKSRGASVPQVKDRLRDALAAGGIGR